MSRKLSLLLGPPRILKSIGMAIDTRLWLFQIGQKLTTSGLGLNTAQEEECEYDTPPLLHAALSTEASLTRLETLPPHHPKIICAQGCLFVQKT